jgi:sarcosine oxidase
MRMESYDAIVLGTGGVGSAALMHLAARGAKALGIDRFEPGHDRGSSHGQTRLIRQAYYEHPDYVPLLKRAFELWAALEADTGQQLYHQVGLLQIGSPGGEVLTGVRSSAQQHDLPIENLSAAETQRRFAGFRLDDDCEAVFESRAGYLLVESCVRAHAERAVHLGARLHSGETVRSWQPDGSGVLVQTDRTRYSAARLIVAAGPWSASLLGSLAIPLEVRRKPLYWFRPATDVYRAVRPCPAFLYDLEKSDHEKAHVKNSGRVSLSTPACFYGVPQIDARGVKVAEHSGGRVVADPLVVDRANDPTDQRHVAGFVERYLTQSTTECTDYSVCMYTMTPDQHFVVDLLPGHPQVAFAAGLSGHGFKFTGVLGEALAQLALDGKTPLPISFLSAARESLRPM